MKLLKDIIRGAGYLEGYGHHPGNATIVFLIVLCGLSGIEKGGSTGFIIGGILGAMAFLPAWCAGSVSRARAYQRSVERTFKILKEA